MTGGLDIKISGVIGGVTIFVFGLEFALFILTIMAFPSTAMIVTTGPIAWLFEVELPIVFMEAGIYWVRESLHIDTNKIESEKVGDSFFARIANAYAVISRFSWIPTTIILFGILAISDVLFVTKSSFGTFNPRFEFFLFLFFYAVYILFLRKHVISRLYKFTKYMNRSLPTYTLENDGISLDLKIINLGDRNKKYVVKIFFKELTEIKELSYIETQALIEYKIGPDLGLVAASAKDQYDYLKNTIPKPRYYIYGPSSGVKTLLLRGDDIFYLISVGNQDTDKLIAGFHASKNQINSAPASP